MPNDEIPLEVVQPPRTYGVAPAELLTAALSSEAKILWILIDWQGANSNVITVKGAAKLLGMTTAASRKAFGDLVKAGFLSREQTPGGGSYRITLEKGGTAPEKEDGNPSWLTGFGDAEMAKTGGAPSYGEMARSMKPLVDQHGPEKTLAHWMTYLRETEIQFISYKRFAQTFGNWGQVAQRQGVNVMPMEPGTIREPQDDSKAFMGEMTDG